MISPTGRLEGTFYFDEVNSIYIVELRGRVSSFTSVEKIRGQGATLIAAFEDVQRNLALRIARAK